MPYTVTKNQTLLMDPSFSAIDQGWRIENGKAIHNGCFAGVVTLKNIFVSPGTWNIEYTVSGYGSGLVYPILGTVNGTNETSNGLKKATVVVPDGAANYLVKFYSDGNLTVDFTQVYPELENEDNGVTLGFDIKENKWVTRYSFAPEMMLRFTNSFFMFLNGELWRSNVNPLRNNFFGVQYKSSIDFVHNEQPNSEKQYWTIKIDSNGKWSVPELTTPATDLFPIGMKSRIKADNFQQDGGNYWADFLRDLNDPDYYTAVDAEKPIKALEALTEGRVLQGSTMVLRIENTDTKEVKLTGVYIYTSDAERNF